MNELCHRDAVAEQESKGFKVNGHALFVVKFDGQIHVYENSCPHLGINLEFQEDQFLDMEKRYIQCANHMALFEIESGDCISGPCSGQSLTKIPFSINEEGMILVE